MQTARTNLIICWWKGLTQSTLLSKLKNIDYVTAYQSKSKQNNNNQTITNKKKSDYATTIPYNRNKGSQSQTYCLAISETLN